MATFAASYALCQTKTGARLGGGGGLAGREDLSNDRLASSQFALSLSATSSNPRRWRTGVICSGHDMKRHEFRHIRMPAELSEVASH